jgi:hypothetical protein
MTNKEIIDELKSVLEELQVVDDHIGEDRLDNLIAFNRLSCGMGLLEELISKLTNGSAPCFISASLPLGL